jgi:curved DNA-binding protein CbpA
MDSEAIFEWLFLLDHLDYYELFRIDRTATADEVRDAFHAFASAFHPDGHGGRSSEERDALDAIFKRGTEAYAVLADPGMRARYDEALARVGDRVLPPRIRSIPPPSSRAPSSAPARLEDIVRTASARPFARRAEELLEKGDIPQAKLQLELAAHKDPDNDALTEYLRSLGAGTKIPK